MFFSPCRRDPVASPSRALLFSLFPLITVRCAALRGGGGGRRGGGSAGRGGAVRAVGDGPHSGLRVYRSGEVDAMDEADQLFYLLQGAVHLLLSGQDAVLHFHAFLQQREGRCTEPEGCGLACQPLGEGGPSLAGVQPLALFSAREWVLLPKEGRGPGGERERANDWFKSQLYLTLGLKTKGEFPF